MIQAVKNFPNKTLVYLMIISSLQIILVIAFRWPLLSLLTPFLEPLLEIVSLVLFMIVSFWALGYFVMKHREVGYRARLPLIVSIITILILVFVPFSKLALKMNWISNYNARIKIVQMIENGELDTAMLEKGQVNLPDKYKDASEGGKILFSRKGSRLFVFFFTFQGILNGYSGFAYVSDNDESHAGLGGPYIEVKKMEDRWFWCESYN